MFSEEFASLSYTNAEDTHLIQEKIMKKRNINDKVPYGRKRSCWKKNYSSEEAGVNKSVPEAGVITCAICGIQRYYKFIKQTKKFGLHSCEPCRKFISSLIQIVRHGKKVVFSCDKKGPENCLITESFPLKTSSVKSKKDALSNMRCKACWLTLCLEKYQMPIGLRNSLIMFISEDDRPEFNSVDFDDTVNEIDFKTLTKRKLQNTSEERSCLKVLSEMFLKNAGLDPDDDKVVILRIRC